MAVTSKSFAAESDQPADGQAAEAEPTAEPTAEPVAEAAPEPTGFEARKAAGLCVVEDGTPHVGRAVNGLVCSRHAMHYDALGRPRNV